MTNPDELFQAILDRQVRYQHEAYEARRRPRPPHSLTKRLRAVFGR
jgi:hypothetical protein